MKPQDLWRAIHVYPFVRGVEGFGELLTAVRSLLPGGCDCRVHFDAYLAADPPDTSSPDALFIWTWRFHQAVNARLGKPNLPLAGARAMYSPSRMAA